MVSTNCGYHFSSTNKRLELRKKNYFCEVTECRAMLLSSVDNTRRAGAPAKIVLGGTLSLTTDPAAIIASFPT